MSTSPINIFQKLMQRWDSAHPYNAAQVMQIQGEADADMLQSAWTSALSTSGLGRLNIIAERYQFEVLKNSDGSYPLAYPQVSLEDHVSFELNRPFLDPLKLPFRPFVIRQRGSYFAGVVYMHWIADSVSIRMLLREWFVRVYDPARAHANPFHFPRCGYWNLIGPHRGGWHMGQSAMSMIRRHTRMRRVRKIDSHALEDLHTAFALFPAEDVSIKALRTIASARRVKLNDVFLAALVETAARHVPMQHRANRPDIAVGSVVDLRSYCRDDLSNTFGLFLGFTNVVCRPEDLSDFDRLLRVIANQTRLQKNTGVAQASLMWMAAARGIGRLSKLEDLYRFYRKELPLAGGISNVDLSKSWTAHYPALLDYIRVSPSGPMAPMVITTTTLGERFHIGLTYRTGLIDPARAGRIALSFLDRLRRLCACAQSGKKLIVPA